MHFNKNKLSKSGLYLQVGLYLEVSVFYLINEGLLKFGIYSEVVFNTGFTIYIIIDNKETAMSDYKTRAPYAVPTLICQGPPFY